MRCSLFLFALVPLACSSAAIEEEPSTVSDTGSSKTSTGPGSGSASDPTGVSSSPTSTDEAYNALLYVGNIKYCPADVSGDGVIDLVDFFQFFNDFDQTLPGADVNGDYVVDLGDFFAFFNAFDQPC